MVALLPAPFQCPAFRFPVRDRYGGSGLPALSPIARRVTGHGAPCVMWSRPVIRGSATRFWLSELRTIGSGFLEPRFLLQASRGRAHQRTLSCRASGGSKFWKGRCEVLLPERSCRGSRARADFFSGGGGVRILGGGMGRKLRFSMRWQATLDTVRRRTEYVKLENGSDAPLKQKGTKMKTLRLGAGAVGMSCGMPRLRIRPLVVLRRMRNSYEKFMINVAARGGLNQLVMSNAGVYSVGLPGAGVPIVF